MDTFLSYGYEPFSGAPSFYPSEEELHNSLYMNMESKIRRALLDPDFDRYSDVSIDSSSSFSFNSSEYLNYTMNQNSYCRSGPVGESLMHYGKGTLTHSESPQSSRWSDDEMSELLSFDQARLLSPNMTLDEEEERRYLSELINQDMMAAELGSYPRSIEDSRWNLEPRLQDMQEDYFHSAQIWNKEHEAGFFYENKIENLSRYNKPVQNNPNTNRTLQNPNNRKNNLEKKLSQSQIQGKVGSTQTKNKEKSLLSVAGASSLNVVSKTKVKNKQINLTNDDEQRVFLGGLPIGMTERMLRQQLAAQGYKVLKRPKILHGFAPEVWMRTVDQAKDLIERGTILIDGLEVEVRPYNSLTKLSELKKLPNVGKRSVFIGGLSNVTTTKNLQDVLLDMGMKVINYPVIKHGFARQVILDTISQAKSLIQMRKVKVNGIFVDVRPFVNQKRRRRIKKMPKIN